MNNSKEKKEKRLVRRLVCMLSRGSVKLQRGQYVTENNVKIRKNELADYSFKVG